jgi:restriction system protein
MPSLGSFKTRDDLRAGLQAFHPDASPKTLSNWESQLWPFAHVIQKGDLVVMPLKTRSAIAIGRVSGDYAFRTDLGTARHTRAVTWLSEVPRAAFAQDLLYSFGSFMTVCRVARNNAQARVEAVLDGKPDPELAAGTRLKPLPHQKAEASNGIEPADAPEDIDIALIAEDRIRMRLGTVFKGHKLSTLIGAVLTTEGYRVAISPPGADGGVDIVAGKGPLGFDHPRLIVQVKSQDSAVDASVLRELQGVMQQHGADHGLLVAWGGVTKALAREAQRLFFKIRIWDAGDVVRAVQASYETLPEDMQSELPLARIWVLAQID